MLTALVLAASLASAPGAQHAPPLVAVWYGGGKARAPLLEPNPRERKDAWRKDLQAIKATGFSAIRCWIDWASAEPKEGEYHFETLEVLTELAEEAGVEVIVQVYVDSAPEWVGRKFPDAHFVSISGDVMPSHAAPGYCVDHPGVRDAVLRLFTALAERMKGRRAFHGWDLWSEPHVINWAQATWLPSAEFCFCPHTVGRFRAWLQQRYGSLEALNRAWYRRFESWDDVGPNRLGTILSYTDFIDWRTFISDKLRDDLRARYDAVKKVLPDRVATSHAAAPSLFTSPLSGDGTPDDWRMAKVVDYWGTSFDPKHSFPVGRDEAWRAALLDFARSPNPNGFWVGELQGGFGTVALRLSSTVTAPDVRLWMWSALARGAKGVNVYAWYPMSSGYESGGFGLIQLDGTITERARAAGRVAKAVQANRDLFAKARPVKSEVGIVYNPLSYMVGGRRPLIATAAQGEVVNIERNSMLGLYRALFPSNVPVDFIHADELGSVASRYKLILVPYPLMLSERAGRALADYVRNGGALVSEARLAWNDEGGRAREVIPGFGLDQVCGCRETAVQQTPTGKTEITLEDGTKIRGALYEEVLEPSSSARVVGRFADGSPAIVESRHGKGKMLTIGTFAGVQYEVDREEPLAKWIRSLLDWAAVSRPVDAPGLEVRMSDNGVLFVFNHGPALDAVIKLSMPDGTYRVRDLESGASSSATAENGTLTLRRTFEAQDVWVVALARGVV